MRNQKSGREPKHAQAALTGFYVARQWCFIFMKLEHSLLILTFFSFIIMLKNNKWAHPTDKGSAWRQGPFLQPPPSAPNHSLALTLKYFWVCWDLGRAKTHEDVIVLFLQIVFCGYESIKCESTTLFKTEPDHPCYLEAHLILKHTFWAAVWWSPGLLHPGHTGRKAQELRHLRYHLTPKTISKSIINKIYMVYSFDIRDYLTHDCIPTVYKKDHSIGF